MCSPDASDQNASFLCSPRLERYKVPRIDLKNSQYELFKGKPVMLIADALLIKMSIPPNFFTACSKAFFTESSTRRSHCTGKHFPPAFSISSAAVKMVPSNLGCFSAVFAAMITLALSLASLRAIALPIPRLPPETNTVFPRRALKEALSLNDKRWNQWKRHSSPRVWNHDVLLLSR